MQPFGTLLIYYSLTAVQALLLGPDGRRCLQGHTLDIFHLSKLSLSRTGERFARGGIVLGARFVDPCPDDAEDSTAKSWDNSLGESQDHDRWEKIWREGEEEKRKSSFLTGMTDWGSGASGDVDVEVAMPVEVVSFDLDDTLWSTKGVIDAANAALQEHLEREHPALAEKCVIPDLMKEIWKERMTADPSLDSSPVNLTELRKAGLARACQITGADPSAVVESSFQVWRKARHDVEPYLFPGVLETLKALQERGVKLVAITNGNAQTDDIPCLKGLFEICVMAEEVGERKPQAGPFREAAKRAGYPSEEYIGGEWVHVGDDWASDCVGAKTMRMRTILVRVPGKPRLGQPPEGAEDEEEEESEVVFDAEDEDEGYPVLKDESVSESGRVGAAWRVTEEKEKMSRRAEKLGLMIDGDFEVAAGVAGPNRERKKTSKEKETPSSETTSSGRKKTKKEGSGPSLDGKVGKYGKELAAIAMGDYSSLGGSGKLMSMGSSSYVMDMLMKDFMDVSLDNISEVLATVDKWNAEYSAISASNISGDDNARLSVAEAARQRTAAEQTDSRTTSSERSVKFCMECGEKIPVTAKFCPMCGTKQVSVSSA